MINETDRLLNRPSGLRGLVAGYVVASVAQGVVFASLVPILRAVFDGMLWHSVPWLAVMGVAALVSGTITWFITVRSWYVGIDNVTGGLMRRIGNHLVTLPLGWFAKTNPGDLSGVVTTSTAQVMTVPGIILMQLTNAIVTPLTVIAVTFFVDWRMGVAFVLFTPLGWVLYRRIQHKAAPAQQYEAATHTDVASRVIEYAQAQPVLRAAGIAEDGWRRLDQALETNRRATKSALRTNDGPVASFMAVIEIAFAVILVTGAYLALNGMLWPADFVAILILAVRFVEPVTFIGPYGSGLRAARNALDSIAGVLDAKALPEASSPQQPQGSSVEFERVDFAYDTDRVLRNFSLSCPAGTMTALVGPSGSGKTTVTRLLARFYDVDAGAIRIGGVDVRDMSTQVLMAQISMVFQNVYLLNGTIEDNVRLAKPDATDTEIEDAARAARLDEVVDRLPLGWQTPVGEGGSRLSGGERQRVSIARALLKNAPIVLLDEATAALDAENEAAITAAMRELAHNRTVLVIAHRLSTISQADQIAVLEDGTVSQRGTHSELRDQQGRYAQFWHARDRASQWRIAARTADVSPAP